MTHRIARSEKAFLNARGRIATATSMEDSVIALGEALNWAHSLEDWHRKRLGNNRYSKERGSRTDGQIVGGLTFARNFDHHDLVTVAAMGDVYTDFFTEMFGTLVWRDKLPPPPNPRIVHGRDKFYAQHLADKAVLDTLVVAQQFFTYIRPV